MEIFQGRSTLQWAKSVKSRRDAKMASISNRNPLAKDNQIRLLAVAHKERVSVAPDVPTLPEQGIAGVDIDFWLGMLAPAGTPAETVTRYNTVLNEVLRSPKIIEKLTTQGFVAIGGTPSDFGGLIARDLAKWRKVVKEAGITPE